MSKLLKISGFALLALFVVSDASAKQVSISGNHSRGEIAATCAANGGVGSNTQGTHGGYGCWNLDKGTGVECTAKGKCTGYVPD